MADLKGNTKRVLSPPGYHLGPEYDLPLLRNRMKDGAKKDLNVVLPLTSMIDMFSMLVIFLLLNFSTTGEVFFVNKNMILPEAQNAQLLEGLPLISIGETIISLDAQVVGENPLSIEETDYKMPQLRQELSRLKQLQIQINGATEFKGRINLQADENTAVIYVKRVMNTLIEEGWTQINFAVRPPE
ncbi:MAG: ExbD/TolR family protein [Bdellovibrionales bacterium]